ncbi:unannotated protein [freshwater metagenome]|uniref:Unannotated protein n=1 Tax=freshwater metagenome TaxID=449393 RepID=A0A6J7PM81_9ZZZZ
MAAAPAGRTAGVASPVAPSGMPGARPESLKYSAPSGFTREPGSARKVVSASRDIDVLRAAMASTPTVAAALRPVATVFSRGAGLMWAAAARWVTFGGAGVAAGVAAEDVAVVAVVAAGPALAGPTMSVPSPRVVITTRAAPNTDDRATIRITASPWKV